MLYPLSNARQNSKENNPDEGRGFWKLKIVHVCLALADGPYNYRSRNAILQGKKKKKKEERTKKKEEGERRKEKEERKQP